MHMFLVLDRQNLKLVAGSNKLSHIGLVAEVEFSSVPVVILNTGDGGSWTILTELEMKMLYRNMSGMEPPSYGDCVAQLRQFGQTFPVYPKSEPELEAQLKAMQALDTPEDIAERQEAADAQTQANYQAIIDGAHAAATAENPALARPAEAIPATQAAAASKPATAAKSEPSAPRKPGATKMVWDICDGVANGEPPTDWKAFREKAKAACIAAGINEGTFGVQFGKWKTSKGV